MRYASKGAPPFAGDPISFSNQVVVITGGARGLGKDYALESARRGAAVVVNGVSRNADGVTFAEEVTEEIRASGGAATADHHSIADPDDAPKVIDVALREYGQVDAVISNAGLTHFSSVVDTGLDLFMSMLRLHLVGAFVVAQRAFPHMAARGYGRIVLTASSTGLFGRGSGVAYASGKSGLIGLMNTLAIEGAHTGILTNMISPVASTTIGTRAVVVGDAAEHATLVADSVPRADPSFVTPLALYLASDRCKTTQGIFSAAYGRFARISIALGTGWRSSDDLHPPTPEDIGQHWENICQLDTVAFPSSMSEEVEAAKVGR